MRLPSFLFLISLLSASSLWASLDLSIECALFTTAQINGKNWGPHCSIEGAPSFPQLINASQLCARQQKSLDCEPTFEKYPELRANKRDCSPKGTCEDIQDSLGSQCLNGYLVGTGEMFVGLKDLTIEGANFLRSQFLNSFEKSLQNPNAPFDLTYLEQASPLLKKLQQDSKRKTFGADFSKKQLRLENELRNRQLQQHQSQQLKLQKMKEIFQSFENMLAEKGLMLQCVDQKTQDFLKCWWASYLLDPTAAIGLFAKPVRGIQALKSIEKIVQSSNARKLDLDALAKVKPIPDVVHDVTPDITPGSLSDRRTQGKPQVAKRGSQATRSAARQAYIDQHFGKEVPTTNEEFGLLALESNKTPMTFFHSEAALKPLNKALGDKDFVTAFTADAKRRTLSRLDSRKGLGGISYADYKGVARGIPGANSEKLFDDLGQVYNDSILSLSQDLRLQNLIRAKDKPTEWFSGGVGESADRANVAARLAREEVGEKRFLRYEAPDVQSRLSSKLQEAESLRLNILKQFKGQAILDGDNLSFRTFEALRASDSPKELMETLSKYKTPLNYQEAELLLNYKKRIDIFGLNPFIAKREVVDLSNAHFGGIAIDDRGMGAWNMQSLARSLQGVTSPDQALARARLAEQEVTREFIENKKKKLTKLTQDFLTKSSGDDTAGAARRVLSESDQQSVLSQLAQDPETSRIRAVFLNEGVHKPEARNEIARHGDMIGKRLRTRLEGKIESDRLDQLIFGVRMQTRIAERGPVGLFVSDSQGRTLNALPESERKLIKQQLSEAIQEVNKTLLDESGHFIDYKPSL